MALNSITTRIRKFNNKVATYKGDAVTGRIWSTDTALIDLTGLELYYKFDDDLTDSSGNGEDLTEISTASYTTDSISNKSSSGGVYGLDSSTINSISGELSFSLWINVASGGSVGLGYMSILSKNDYALNPANDGWILRINPYIVTPTLRFEILVSNTIYLYNINNLPSYGFSLDNWHHITLTRSSGGNVKIYVDGTYASPSFSSVNGQPIQNTDTLRIRRIQPTFYYTDFNGNIDEFSFWSRELTAAEVSDLYNGGVAGTSLIK